MKYPVSDIMAILEKLALKTGESLDYYGTGVIAEKIAVDTIKHKYLYDRLLMPTKKKSPDDTLSLKPNYIDELVKFLGYQNYTHFKRELENPLHDVLKSISGNYYSYVRKNSEEGYLLRSPVSIQIRDDKVVFLLKGNEWRYEGDVHYVDGCIYCLMLSKESGKFFHHVYRIGKRMKPKVLQGIFSGVSSSNEPIGGRCILERRDEEIENLTNQLLRIEELEQHDEANMKRLARYFKSYEVNNLKIAQSLVFDFHDL